jgi:arginyl-tRNA synthetase
MNSYVTIYNELKKVVHEESIFSLASSDDSLHGDYATNIAFVLSKEKGTSPKECAESILPILQESCNDIVQKIEIAGPGFINFFLKDEVIREENGKGDVELVTKYSGKNILVEHSSPNLFKPFHIGHLVNNIIGEFVARAIQVGGGNVSTMSFPSDISLGIAKAVYIIKDDKDKGNDVLGSTNDEGAVIPYLGECYRRGVALSDENPELESKIKDVAKDLFNQIDGGELKVTDVYDIYTRARTLNLVYFQNVIEGLGTHIDYYVYESEAGKIGKELVLKNRTIFSEGERGAIIYTPDESRKDLNTAVFINSEGHPTYEAKDLGLIEEKFTGYGSVDLSYFVTDSEQVHHFKIVLDAGSKLGGDWPERVAKSIHIPHGRMLFKGAKMSSRLGGVPLALDVIEVVEEEVRERAGEKIAHLEVEEKKKLEREIALSALRIAVLRSKPGININFDPETSLSFEGDSGPYLLYTHARCCSLLEKGKDTLPQWGNFEVTNLEKKLIHFERELIAVCEELAPQKLVTYLFSIAQEFNAYYASNQIIVEGDTAGNVHRLMIVKRVQEVLKRGLHVLGIKAPERM